MRGAFDAAPAKRIMQRAMLLLGYRVCSDVSASQCKKHPQSASFPCTSLSGTAYPLHSELSLTEQTCTTDSYPDANAIGHGLSQT